MTLKYITTLQFAGVLGIKKDVPSWEQTQEPEPEFIGTGDSVASVFYLDHKNVIAGSYVFYYGATSSSLTALTETTHYVIDKTKGKITLTAAGITILSTNNLYGEYSYFDHDVSDEYLQSVLERAEQYVDRKCSSTFVNGNATNPSYSVALNESHKSQGLFNRTYMPFNKPIIDLTTSLVGDITSASATLVVTTGNTAKFPTTGILVIDNEIITYTGITAGTHTFTGLGRGAYGSTAAAHTSGATIHTTAVQVSGTAEGSSPTWTTLAHDSECFVDVENSSITVHNNVSNNTLYVDQTVNPKQDVPNRFRISYLYGYDFIPADIQRAALLAGEMMIATDNILSSLFKGRNEFRFEGLERRDKEEFDSIISNYAISDIANT